MNRLLILFLFAGVFIFCGCGPRYWWSKPGVGDAQVRRDCRKCLRQADAERFAMSYEEWKNAKTTGRPYRDYHSEFYRDSNQDYNRPMFRERANINKCMKKKGYFRVRIDG